MRWYLPLALLLGQNVLATDEIPPRPPSPPPPTLPRPRIDRDDPRFLDFRPPGPGDSRSPCPGLNALANHGFLPRNGRAISVADVIRASYVGLGVSPETSGMIGAAGLASSHNRASNTFDLEDLAKHLYIIEHDGSFSRNDLEIGDNNNFNRTIWNVALEPLKEHSIVTPFRLGRAKGIRVKDAKQRNPSSVYGPRAAAFGAVEAGLVLSALGSPVPGFAKLEYVRCLFEEERLPYHLGWRPLPLAVNFATVMAYAAVAVAADPYILPHGIDVVLGTPSDIIQSMLPPDRDVIADIAGTIRSMGFNEDFTDTFWGFLGIGPGARD